MELGSSLIKTKEKLEYLTKHTIDTLNWDTIIPDKNNDWLNKRNDDFEKFIPIGDKKDKSLKCIMMLYSLGISTNRDAWTYNFSYEYLKKNIDSCKQLVIEGFIGNVGKKRWQKL